MAKLLQGKSGMSILLSGWNRKLSKCRFMGIVACATTILFTCFYLPTLQQLYKNRIKVQGWYNMSTQNLSGILARPDLQIHFRTYGTYRFAGSKQRIMKEAKQTGWFTSGRVFGPEDLPIEFTQRYGEILKERRGAGYWIWKFWLIESTLDEMQTGDFLLYLDAGCQVNAAGEPRFREYLAMLSASPFDILTFTMGLVEHTYTTERVFGAFGVDAATQSIRASGQHVGGILLLRKGEHLRRWLSMVNQVLEADPWIITDKYNDEARRLDPAFIDARHDQSISSVSRKLMGSVVLSDETSRQEKYPFWASRLRN